MNIKSFFQITKGSSTSGTSSTDNDQLKVDRKRKIEESKADVSNLLINKEAPRKRSKNTTKNYKNEEDDDDVVSIIIEDDLFDNLSSKKALKSPNKVKANPTSSNSPTSKHIKMKPESSTDNIQKMESKDIFEEGEDHYITSPSGKKRKTLSKSPIRKKSNGQTSIDKKSTTSAVEGKRGHKHTKTERLSFLQKSSFKDLCFVFTGDLQTVSREEMEEKVKRYNGLLRTSVSGNTDFLIVGQNPGQKKMEKAQELQETLVQLTEQEFLAWFAKVEHQFYIDQKELEDRQLLLASEGETLSDDVADGARDRDSIIQKDSIVNSSKIGTNESAIGIKSSLVKNVQLWTEKYRPHQTDEVIGGLSQINKIKTFLQEWNATSTGRGGASTKRALLISGFPGIGKTSSAIIACREAGFVDVIEFNASDKRNKSSLSEIRELVHSRQSIRGKQCLIMDEVDGMSGGDRGGISELCQIIKHSQIPIICICNDRYKPCLKSLVSLCDEVKFSKPNKLAITKRLMDICKKEGLMITENALAQLIESSNNDIRSVLNSLQMATYSGSSQSRFTFDDACKHGTDSGALPDNFFLMTSNLMTRGKRPSDYRELLSYYFDDTMLMPLMVQQNYLNYDPIKRGTTNPSNSSSLKQRQMRMKMIANAADAMSFGDTIHTLNNFSLSPIQGYYSVILPTGLICGSYEKIMPFDNFFPTFPAMLGKLSTARKNFSLLQTMRDEMISSIKDGNYNGNGDLLGIMMEVQDVREYYVPLWRREIMQKLIAGDVGGTINRLDDYHLTKDDLIGLNELATLGDKTLNLYANNVPAKVKNSLTRNYNKKHQMSRFRRGGNNNNNGDGDQDDDGDDILENGLDMNGMSADGAEDDVE